MSQNGDRGEKRHGRDVRASREKIGHGRDVRASRSGGEVSQNGDRGEKGHGGDDPASLVESEGEREGSKKYEVRSMK